MYCDDEIKIDYEIYKERFSENPMTFEEYYDCRKELINKYDIYDDHSIFGDISIDCVFCS